MNFTFFAGKKPDPFPRHLELVPDELSASIYLHTVEKTSLSCWCYVTKGLAKHKQREMIFTLVRNPGEKPEDYPADPLEFFGTLLQLSKQGRTVSAGGQSSFAPNRALLGFVGLTYLNAIWTPPETDPFLAMIGLTPDELEVLQTFGYQRLFSIFAKADGCYPAPYWNLRSRPSRVSAQRMQDSLLMKVPRVYNSGFSVFLHQGRLLIRGYLSATQQSLESVRSLKPDQVFALLTKADVSADGALAWEPGQTQTMAVTPPGSRGQHLGGSFVIIAPEQEADSHRIIEDGFMLLLTPESWRSLRTALLEKQPLATPVFELAWIPEGCELYLPQTDTPLKGSGNLSIDSLTLFQSDQQLKAAGFDSREFASFATAIEQAVVARLSPTSVEGHFQITIEISPGRAAQYRLTSGFWDNTAAQEIWKELKKLPVPAVKQPVGFAMNFRAGESEKSRAASH